MKFSAEVMDAEEFDRQRNLYEPLAAAGVPQRGRPWWCR